MHLDKIRPFLLPEEDGGQEEDYDDDDDDDTQHHSEADEEKSISSDIEFDFPDLSVAESPFRNNHHQSINEAEEEDVFSAKENLTYAWDESSGITSPVGNQRESRQSVAPTTEDGDNYIMNEEQLRQEYNNLLPDLKRYKKVVILYFYLQFCSSLRGDSLTFCFHV